MQVFSNITTRTLIDHANSQAERCNAAWNLFMSDEAGDRLYEILEELEKRTGKWIETTPAVRLL